MSETLPKPLTQYRRVSLRVFLTLFHNFWTSLWACVWVRKGPQKFITNVPENGAHILTTATQGDEAKTKILTVSLCLLFMKRTKYRCALGCGEGSFSIWLSLFKSGWPQAQQALKNACRGVKPVATGTFVNWQQNTILVKMFSKQHVK